MNIIEDLSKEVSKFKSHMSEDESFRNLINDSRIIDIAMAAMAYIYVCWAIDSKSIVSKKPYSAWPWPIENYKPKDDIPGNIIRAMALLVLGVESYISKSKNE